MAKWKKIGIRDYASTAATSLTVQACTIIQGVLLARTLGPSGRGEFVAMILWPTFFASIFLLGLPAAVSRRSARAEDSGKLIQFSLLLTLGTSCVGILLCGLFLPILIPQSEPPMLRGAIWYLPFIYFYQVTLVLMAIDQGRGEFTKFNWTRLVINPVFLIGILFLWILGVKDAFEYVMALLVANATVALIRLFGAVSTIRHSHSFSTSLDVGPFGLLKESLPYGVSSIVGLLFQQTDKVLLLFLMGTKELGIYSVAMTAGMVGGTLSSAASTVVFGVSAQAGDRSGHDQIARVFRLSSWVWLLVGTGLALVIPFLLPLVYGKEFNPAIIPALILIPASALGGQAGILEEALRAQGRPFLGVMGRFFGLIVMGLMGSTMVPHFGILGVGFAFVAAQTVILGVMIFSFGSHFQLSASKLLTPRVGELNEIYRRGFDFGQKMLKYKSQTTEI